LNALRKSGCSSIKTREKYTPRGSSAQNADAAVLCSASAQGRCA
jgi:hypothetical protein